jgi:hypothetical protein
MAKTHSVESKNVIQVARSVKKEMKKTQVTKTKELFSKLMEEFEEHLLVVERQFKECKQPVKEGRKPRRRSARRRLKRDSSEESVPASEAIAGWAGEARELTVVFKKLIKLFDFVGDGGLAFAEALDAVPFIEEFGDGGVHGHVRVHDHLEVLEVDAFQQVIQVELALNRRLRSSRCSSHGTPEPSAPPPKPLFAESATTPAPPCLPAAVNTPLP